LSSDWYAVSWISACLKVYVAAGGSPRAKRISASTRRASPCRRAASSMPTIAASSGYPNSRPSTAARCATSRARSFAAESRSSRAISESARLAGMASTPRAAPGSAIALVSSST